MSLIFTSQNSAFCMKCFGVFDRLPLVRRDPTKREPRMQGARHLSLRVLHSDCSRPVGALVKAILFGE